MGENHVVGLEEQDGIAWIWLQRPDVHNAFNAQVVDALARMVADLAGREDLRAVVLAARGRSFSAGADLNWMQNAGDLTREENEADAIRLATMLRKLSELPQATVARVQGAAFGGGLGLIACCDVAIAASRARFGFSEVNLGLIPAVISPHVIARIGPGHARHLFVTGERFDAARAERIGLVSRVVPDEPTLDQAVGEVLQQIQTSSPDAVRAAKHLIRQVTTVPGAEIDAVTARLIATQRASEAGKEGITAFLDKRPPSWAAAPRTS